MIQNEYWDPTALQPLWSQSHARALAAVRKASTVAEARAAESAMLVSLGKSHFAIIPKTLYKSLSPAPRRQAESQAAKEETREEEYHAGFETTLVDDQVVVTSIQPGTPAAMAGISPGCIVERAGPISFTDVLKPMS